MFDIPKSPMTIDEVVAELRRRGELDEEKYLKLQSQKKKRIFIVSVFVLSAFIFLASGNVITSLMLCALSLYLWYSSEQGTARECYLYSLGNSVQAKVKNVSYRSYFCTPCMDIEYTYFAEGKEYYKHQKFSGYGIKKGFLSIGFPKNEIIKGKPITISYDPSNIENSTILFNERVNNLKLSKG